MNSRFWKNKNIFVTGATGLVGSWLVKDLLKNSCSIVALVFDCDLRSELCRSQDIQRIKVEKGRLENFSLLKKIISKHRIDGVFHLGAQTIVNQAYESPFLAFESNVRGTYNILEACRLQKKIPYVVVASSDKAYGYQKNLPYREDSSPLEGRFPYDVSKSCADLLAQSYFHSYGLPISIARCGNIYGGGDLHFSRIVPGTICSLLQNERPVLRSDGKYTRDYIYVRDIALAYLHLMEKMSDKKTWGQAFNFSVGKPLSVLEIVLAVQKAMNKTHLKPDILNNAKGEIHHQHLTSSKARRILGWKPHFNLSQGLRETILWYEQLFSK